MAQQLYLFIIIIYYYQVFIERTFQIPAQGAFDTVADPSQSLMLLFQSVPPFFPLSTVIGISQQPGCHSRHSISQSQTSMTRSGVLVKQMGFETWIESELSALR